MSSLFILVVPGYPPVTSFQQIEERRFITQLPNPSSISEVCFSVQPGFNIPECGIVIYYSFGESNEWNILGTITTQAPSGIFRTTWSTMNVENVPYVYFGISLERESFVTNLRGFVPSPYERELPVLKIVQDLYNFISSFESDSSDRIILPKDVLSAWLEKTKAKLQRNPKYFYSLVS